MACQICLLNDLDDKQLKRDDSWEFPNNELNHWIECALISNDENLARI